MDGEVIPQGGRAPHISQPRINANPASFASIFGSKTDANGRDGNGNSYLAGRKELSHGTRWPPFAVFRAKPACHGTSTAQQQRKRELNPVGAVPEGGVSLRLADMNPEFVVELLKNMMFQAVTLAAPILVTAMVIGLAVSLFQAVTTISEQTLTFVPKALGIVALLIVLLPWLLRSIMEYSVMIIEKMPQMVN
jgi:flagellar biosynthesis protein FliQ